MVEEKQQTNVNELDRLDADTANRAMIAFAAVWRYDGFEEPPSDRIYTMFCVAGRTPGSPSNDYSDLVRQSGYNLVMLEFEPGAEDAGPSGVVVCVRWHDGTIRTFPDCVLWQGPRYGIMTLISSANRMSIAYDGGNLRIVNGVPDGDLAAGITAAKRNLRKVVRRALALKEPLWRVDHANGPH